MEGDGRSNVEDSDDGSMAMGRVGCQLLFALSAGLFSLALGELQLTGARFLPNETGVRILDFCTAVDHQLIATD